MSVFMTYIFVKPSSYFHYRIQRDFAADGDSVDEKSLRDTRWYVLTLRSYNVCRCLIINCNIIFEGGVVCILMDGHRVFSIFVLTSEKLHRREW